MKAKLKALVLAGVVTVAFGMSNPVTAAPQKREPMLAGLVTVTLITGDHVVLQAREGADRVVTVKAGPGRAGTVFRQQVERGDTYVVPVDANILIASGRLDSRLFNVSRLAEAKFDDKSLDVVPVIVTGQAAAPGARSAHALPSIGGQALHIAKTQAGAFWAEFAAPQVKRGAVSGKVWLDAPVKASLDRSTAQIGAPAAWQAGLTGAGALVAVLDTGIDSSHPDLADAIASAADFSASSTGTQDKFGHGTHVAGIITGNGAKYRGVAPEAKLLNGKVLDDYGSGAESWIIAGMEWAAASGADVINMSLGSSWPSNGTDPMDLAVDRLTKETGALFVVSAGNSGGTVGSPAAADEALTVGAVDRADGLADFSSRGPRWENLAIKPDLTAPGVDIVAPLAAGSLLGEFYPVVDDNYLQLSGTSMAAPHVAGAAAILAGQHRDWTASQLKPALMGSAKASPANTVYEQGAGRVDIARAVRQQITASPASLSNGIARWPHQDDTPISRTLTYRNDGDTGITLSIAIDVPHAPPGMFTVDTPTVTVAAHSTATVTVTTDTRVPAPDGIYGGYVLATSGDIAIRTPIGVAREVESYDITLDIIDANGQPTAGYFVRFVDIAVAEAVVPYDASGHVVARVPAGLFYFEVNISTGADHLAVVVEPQLEVRSNATITVDARQAKQIGFSLDQSAAKAGDSVLFFARVTSWGDTGAWYSGFGFDRIFVRPSSTSATVGSFTYGMGALMAKPDGKGGFAGSPYLYHLQWQQPGRVPEQLVPRIRDRDLAVKTTRIAASAPGQVVSKDWVVDLPSPATLTELFTPDTRWGESVVINPDWENFTFDGVISSAPTSYPAGRNQTSRWNVGVFGPAFPTDGPDGVLAGREGDDLSFYILCYADQALNHQGDDRIGTTSLTLRRDGQIIGESPYPWANFRVPGTGGWYELTASAVRPGPLSTRTEVVWRFASAHADEQTPLAFQAVRFAPPLDDHNRARAGWPFFVPVTVQRQDGAPAASLRSLNVQVSYDDGTTWQPVPLIGSGSSRLAVLLHPRHASFVSLRATAVDSLGNSVAQTIIRAYSLR